jgi:hypothetical protein
LTGVEGSQLDLEAGTSSNSESTVAVADIETVLVARIEKWDYKHMHCMVDDMQ